MQPGLTRAIPMAVLGFIVGALFVIVLRALQSVEPLWDPQIGIIVCAFTVSWFFLWGVGAFNPAMSQHAHEPTGDEAHDLALAEAHHIDESKLAPTTILGYSIWQIATWTLVLLVVLFAFALLPGGYYLQITGDPAGSNARNAYIPVQIPFSGDNITWNGETVMFSKLAVFVGFAIFTLLSLAVAGGIIGGVFFWLARNVNEVRAVPNSTLLLDSGSTVVQERTATQTLIELVKLIVAFVVLYLLFYFILVGGLWLVFPTWPTWLRVILSLANAVVFAIIIIQPPFIMQPLGRGARNLARTLRRVSGE